MNSKQITDVLVSLGDATLAATGAVLALAGAGLKKIERGCTKAAVYLFNQTPGTKLTMDEHGEIQPVRKKTTTDEDEFDRHRIDGELSDLMLFEHDDVEDVLRDLKSDIYLSGCVTAKETMEKFEALNNDHPIFLDLPYEQYGWDDLSEAYVLRDVSYVFRDGASDTPKPQRTEYVWKIHFPPVKKLFNHD